MTFSEIRHNLPALFHMVLNVHLLEGFVYLALITDLFSRKIVRFHVSDSLSVEGALRALNMALKAVKPDDALIHHSDRGVQYCAHGYTDLLAARGVKLSMTENDDV